MKQLLYVLLPLTMCMLASCGKEEEVVPEPDPATAPPVVRYAEYETTADYVDFGVGNFMIATRNLGAKRPEDTGYFFVWGEFPACGDYCGCRRNLLLDLRLANRCQPDSHLLFYPPVFGRRVQNVGTAVCRPDHPCGLPIEQQIEGIRHFAEKKFLIFAYTPTPIA